MNIKVKAIPLLFWRGPLVFQEFEAHRISKQEKSAHESGKFVGPNRRQAESNRGLQCGQKDLVNKNSL
jgi:hypothetical protein